MKTCCSYAFAETDSKEEIEKAVKAMDNKLIQGRYLRVRSAANRSRDGGGGGGSHSAAPSARRRDLTVNDVKRHLAYAFNCFLEREMVAIKEGGKKKVVEAEVKKEDEEVKKEADDDNDKEEATTANAEVKEEDADMDASAATNGDDDSNAEANEKVEKLKQACQLIKEAFDLPDDETLKVNNNNKHFQTVSN